MKIAVMLRTLDEKQGIGVYSRNLMSALLDIDRENDYTFLYANKKHVGSFDSRDNLEEVILNCRNNFLWDQWSVYRFARQKRPDIIFNTKFSVPLGVDCKTMMVLHGSEWYVYPEFYSRFDVFYNKIFQPLYCRKAAVISSVSKFTADDMVKFTGISDRKIFVIPSAKGDTFMPVRESAELNRIREKYALPDRYICCVAKSYPGKNLDNIIKAFQTFTHQSGCEIGLVAVGSLAREKKKFRSRPSDLNLNGRIIFTGWVEQDDLPAIYSMADVFLFPSFYEGFGIPILEAMACGCPVITSKTGACPEVAGSAAILVDPYSCEDIAHAVNRLLNDGSLREKIIARGLQHARKYCWAATARMTLDAFQALNAREH